MKTILQLLLILMFLPLTASAADNVVLLLRNGNTVVFDFDETPVAKTEGEFPFLL